MTPRPLTVRPLWIFSLGLLAVMLAVPAVAVGPAQEAEQEDDANVVFAPELFGEMSFRSIGPSRGGRSTAVAGVSSDPLVYYLGATGGGVWKTDAVGSAVTPAPPSPSSSASATKVSLCPPHSCAALPLQEALQCPSCTS